MAPCPHGWLSVFSYAGEVTVGFLVDAGLVDDPQQLADSVRSEVLQLARRARVAGRRTVVA
jgi:hypothetical protein